MSLKIFRLWILGLLFVASASAQNHTQFVTTYQYYFDTDPGVGLTGNGAVVSITPTANFSQNISISIPSLSTGIHFLFVRVMDEFGKWSVSERSLLYVQEASNTQAITAIEYFFDTDPGVGNGNAIPVSAAASINASFNIPVPCLASGTHYLYVRAKDGFNKWSVIELDTVLTLSSIAPFTITPAGPVSFCTGNTILLSPTTPSSGFTYQWFESGNIINGATNSSYTATSTGNYSLKMTCGANFSISNVVAVTVNPPVTYYADVDGDGFGNASVSQLACSQPPNYVLDNTDCNDGNINIHAAIQYFVDADHDGFGSSTTAMVCALTPPLGYSINSTDCDDTKSFVYPGALELCNGIDDNCNNQIDENQFMISSVLTAIKCKGTNTGAIDVNINGGLPPFTYLWNSGSTIQDRENLFAGTYTVTVASGGCTSSASFIITQPETVMSISLSRTTIRCGGKSTGILTALPSGGGFSYSYLWTGGYTTATITGIAAGTYTVTITDNLGCSKTKSIQMTENAPQAVYISPAGPANQFMANRSGGVGPWIYHWNTNPLQASQIATILASGNYRVKVTDSKGCTVISSVYSVAKFDGSIISYNVVGEIVVNPNPSTGSISISGFDCYNCYINLSLTDVTGRLIYQSSEINSDNQLEKDFSFLQKGIYLLRMNFGDKTKTIKLVLK